MLVDEFLDIVDDYEDLVQTIRTCCSYVKELEENSVWLDENERIIESISYFGSRNSRKEASAADESANLINKANFSMLLIFG